MKTYCRFCFEEFHSAHHKLRCRPERIRRVVRVCIEKGILERRGVQVRIAEHFGVTRQRLTQIVQQETLVRR